jgi:ubiquinone/menaquinone biosynthesis C-methylase UbiE
MPQRSATTRLTQSIARSVDASTDLLPVFADLFQGINALGSTPRRLASLVARSSVPRFSEPGASVLDLACGKGAVAVEFAKSFGARVTGVDACGVFLEGAKALARQHRVENHCRWINADVCAIAARHKSRYDVAMMIGLFPLAEAAPLLRRLTKRGGLYVIDDAVLDPDDPDAETFADVPDAGACRALIEGLGDRVERRVLLPRAAMASQNRALLRRLSANAARLSKSHPHLRQSLRAFIARQREASAVLLGPLRPTIWAICRG